MLYERVAPFIGDNNLLEGRIVRVERDICEADTGDGVVKAFLVAARGAGDRVTLAIRPERVELAPAAGRYSNEFDAVVDDIAFLGDHLRVRLTACGSSEFVIKIPNTVGHGAILENDRVRIGFTPIDCRALAPDDGRETC